MSDHVCAQPSIATTIGYEHDEPICDTCAWKKVLADVFSEVAAEWHPTRNGDFTPSNLPRLSRRTKPPVHDLRCSSIELV